VYTLMVAPQVLAGEPAMCPGDLDVPHSWTYTCDVARTHVAISQDDRAWGRAWHVPSTATVSAHDLSTRLAEVAGARAPKLQRMSAEELAAAGVANPILAEV
jgi:nucleoside-diphosphate-sugar epimerase